MKSDQMRLAVFLKAPRAGAVKTRLAQAIGSRAALDAYQQMVDHLVEALQQIPKLQLRFTPDDAAAEVNRWRSPSWEVRPQGAGDLGQRLSAAFGELFSAGAERAVIIGSDCPWVTVQDIEEAWRRLADHDVVLGPAVDGGYWLIGLAQPQPALFENISWSSSDVFEQTLARATAAGLNIALLRQLSDIDTVADWDCFRSAG